MTYRPAFRISIPFKIAQPWLRSVISVTQMLQLNIAKRLNRALVMPRFAAHP